MAFFFLSRIYNFALIIILTCSKICLTNWTIDSSQCIFFSQPHDICSSEENVPLWLRQDKNSPNFQPTIWDIFFFFLEIGRIRQRQSRIKPANRNIIRRKKKKFKSRFNRKFGRTKIECWIPRLIELKIKLIVIC